MSPDAARRAGFTSTVVFPLGNLAPQGSVIKATAIHPSVIDGDGVYRHRGPARVFTDERDAIQAVKGVAGRSVREGDVIVLIGTGPSGTGMRRRVRQIEIAPVVLDRFDWRKRQREVADRLVWHLSQRLRHHLRAHELRRVGVLAVRDQPAHVGERVLRLGVDRIVRTSGPQGVFIQLETFVNDAAEDHRAQSAVAQRQRPHPLGCAGLPRLPWRIERQQRMIGRRRAIPEAERGCGRRGFAGQPRR